MAKILLVEDDNNLREIYEARLLAEGYEIVSARDGEEALTVAMKERPDLIISDVMMPKISGFDMLDIIRTTEETKNAKVIMMTALSQAEDKERADKLGADRYLVKSQVTLEDVAKVAREVLSGQPASSTPVTQPTPAATDTPAAAAPTVAPAPTPATPDPEPAANATTPVPEPATTPAPAPEPAADTSSDDTTTTTAAPPTPITTSAAAATEPTTSTPVAIAAVDTATDAAATALEAVKPATEAPTEEAKELSQTIEDEQSAIAAQIEDFIETKKTAETASASESTPETSAEPPKENGPKIELKTQAPVGTDKAQEETETETEADSKTEKEEVKNPSTTRKVIQPINDPTASQKPKLEELVRKEAEKEDMAALAENMKGAAALAAQPEAPVEHVAPEVAVTEDGDLKIVGADEEPVPPPPAVTTPESKDTAEPTTTPVPAPEAETTKETSDKASPVIPHTNGTSIDGVVAPPAASSSPTTDGPDPNAISL